jgi:hypothetical protein
MNRSFAAAPFAHETPDERIKTKPDFFAPEPAAAKNPFPFESGVVVNGSSSLRRSRFLDEAVLGSVRCERL